MLTVSFWQLLGLGIGVALVIEGLVPFFSPAKWRSVFGQIQQMNDGQLRFFGLISIGIGLTLVLVLIG